MSIRAGAPNSTGDAAPNEPAAKKAAVPGRMSVPMAGLLGIVTVGLTFGIAELLAALAGWFNLLHPSASPIASLGSTFIELTPEWLKDWAIRTFGENDKTALRVGMGISVLLAAIVIGLITRWSPRWGVAVSAALLVVTGAAILTRSDAGVLDLLPLAVGGAAGIWFLVTAVRAVIGLPAKGIQPGGTTAARTPDSTPPATPAAAPDTDRLPAVGGKVVLTGADHPMAAAGATSPTTTTGRTSTVNRRAFFRLAGIGAVVAVAAGAISRWIPSAAQVEESRAAVAGAVPQAADVQIATDSAGTLDSINGITPYVISNDEFYRIDTAFTFPGLTAETWSLKIHGAVDNPFEISFDELIARPMVERSVTLTCVSNPVGGPYVGNAVWQGVRIADLIAEAKPRAEADCVLSTSAQDGFTVTTPLEALTDGRDALLAVKMNGEPLPAAHGFPVRMVVPGLYGYVSATKWVVDLELTRFDEVSAYWTDRGWSAKGPIKTSARIDVPASLATLPAGRVPVAGVAWAQHRGIKAVQVQVDDGEWQEATLSTPVSKDTWVQWVWEWDATPGQHTLQVRAIDGTGELQTGSRQEVIPDGATGWHSRLVTIG